MERDGVVGFKQFCAIFPLHVWCFYRLHIFFRNTHPFNGPLSGTTRVSRYQKGKSNLDFTEARDSEWQWHQLGHMQVCTLLQTDNHTSTPPLGFLRAGCPSCRPANSVKALKARHIAQMLSIGDVRKCRIKQTCLAICVEWSGCVDVAAGALCCRLACGFHSVKRASSGETSASSTTSSWTSSARNSSSWSSAKVDYLFSRECCSRCRFQPYLQVPVAEWLARLTAV